jgi:serine/threonine-protein kinase
MIRSTRSLKVSSDCIEQVKLAVQRNGFPNQKALAYDCGLVLSTVSNFLNGKPVDFTNFLEICQRLNLDWQTISDLKISVSPSKNRGEMPKVLISCHGQNLAQLAKQLSTALETDYCEVVILTEELESQIKGLRQIDKEIEQCDYLLLLLSHEASVSEMVIEEVRQAKRFASLHLHQKPILLTIRVGFPLEAFLNYDLRGYLEGMQQWEWNTDVDTPALIQDIRYLLKTGHISLSSSSNPTMAAPASIPAQYQLQTSPLPVAEPELPEGQVDLASTFYMKRPPIEERCYAAIGKPGALIRIKAPRQMGKTSLMARILHHATQLGCLTAPLSFQLADGAIFADLDKFLQWFCATLSWQLDIPAQLTEHWNSLLGSKMSCTSYFEKYLLPTITTPLVLGLDEVDLVFQYPEIASDFLGLLRAWHESAKNRELWKKLRLVVVHSTEVYVPLNINQSPFNVGLAIELPEFLPEQIEDLAQRHGLVWRSNQVEQLRAMVGGHPFLIRVALHQIAQHEMTLDQVFQTAPTEAGVFRDHLRRHLWNLEQHPDLAVAMKQVVSATSPIKIEAMYAFKLYSLGLVHLQGNEVTARCELYRQYFYDRLALMG